MNAQNGTQEPVTDFTGLTVVEIGALVKDGKADKTAAGHVLVERAITKGERQAQKVAETE